MRNTNCKTWSRKQSRNQCLEGSGRIWKKTPKNKNRTNIWSWQFFVTLLGLLSDHFKGCCKRPLTIGKKIVIFWITWQMFFSKSFFMLSSSFSISGTKSLCQRCRKQVSPKWHLSKRARSILEIILTTDLPLQFWILRHTKCVAKMCVDDMHCTDKFSQKFCIHPWN